MSLVTYAADRPWARSINPRVADHQMPPWNIDKCVGVQGFKNDRSLNDKQIETIVKWVDAGAPKGNPKDMPAPKTWPEDQGWPASRRRPMRRRSWADGRLASIRRKAP